MSIASLRSPESIQKMRGLVIVVLPLLAFLVSVVLLWNRYIFATDVVLLVIMYSLSVLGITVGYHRMLTHQGFQAPAWLRAFFVICGVMAWEGAPVMWVATHIKHHAHSDDDDDPHSPLHGFWNAHCGWIFSHESFPDPQEYAPHLLKDPLVRFIDKYSLVWMTLALLIPFLIGGWTGLLWGGFVRIFLTTHVTWSVNSICHTFGKREFETTDESRNEWIVGLLAFGEGWHNNHHAFPRNAFHGLRWWQLDLSGLLIRGLEKTGLIWDVQRVSPQLEEEHRSRTERMMNALQALRVQVASSIQSARNEMEELRSRLSLPVSLTEEQLESAEQFVRSAAAKLEAMHVSISRSMHMKKVALLRIQKESTELVLECKRRMQGLVPAHS